ncbi:MAG: hypothetical protein PHU24_00880 [Sphaerochaetaceae bacterium]|jgi:pentose-5-phosphate-3-epimerase|nr:hypothetical protein [Sphaerochaetaceae bacterium]MDD2404991.1 hypothetical protein [Sphaerochaetaceae bacterium]MDD4260258.1 hypothetical protein [Sphaerochaetaceae bacterium]MDD4762505.1 hypothetical protein [Sphaerochaetaceae bacterium]MDD5077142.1 hypothetical protein [Sphaerochaetaceae bacterium]
MRQVKISAGLAHVNYGHIADIVKEVSDAGADYIHSDAADMYNLRNLQLMGGHQIVEGIRPFTDKPIEVHAYFADIDKLFIDKIAKAGADMLILPAENFIGAPLAYIMKYCLDYGMKFGLTIGCFTPLSFVEESIYYLDRLHVVIHGVGKNDSDWLWRKSAIPLIRNARKLINERNPKCELCIDGGMRLDNLAEVAKEDIDAMVFSSAIFNHPTGIAAGMKALREAIADARKDL